MPFPMTLRWVGGAGARGLLLVIVLDRRMAFPIPSVSSRKFQRWLMSFSSTFLFASLQDVLFSL